MDLIVEANQELPDWLESVAGDSGRYGGRGPSRGGRGGNKFGGKDALFFFGIWTRAR